MFLIPITYNMTIRIIVFWTLLPPTVHHHELQMRNIYYDVYVLDTSYTMLYYIVFIFIAYLQSTVIISDYALHVMYLTDEYTNNTYDEVVEVM